MKTVSVEPELRLIAVLLAMAAWIIIFINLPLPGELLRLVMAGALSMLCLVSLIGWIVKPLKIEHQHYVCRRDLIDLAAKALLALANKEYSTNPSMPITSCLESIIEDFFRRSYLNWFEEEELEAKVFSLINKCLPENYKVEAFLPKYDFPKETSRKIMFFENWEGREAVTELLTEASL